MGLTRRFASIEQKKHGKNAEKRVNADVPPWGQTPP
jgi:hypothetical protein